MKTSIPKAAEELAEVIVNHPWLEDHTGLYKGLCPSCPDREIHGGHNSPSHAAHVADAILAAGYRKPRTITTVEELKSLEDPDTVLTDYHGCAYQWDITMDGSEGWLCPHDKTAITSNHLWRLAPITVLREPEAAL